MSASLVRIRRFIVLFTLSGLLPALAGCGGGATASISNPINPIVPSITPVTTTTASLGGAQIVSMSDAISGATIYYTTDGSTPTSASVQYLAPFLVTSSITVKSIAVSSTQQSSVVSQSVTASVLPGTLVWAEEFNNTTGANAQPNPAVWTYDTGATGFGNSELEDYCAWGSNVSPCITTNPNAYVDTTGILHITAAQPTAGVYTSARLKSQGLFSMSYGRIEAKIMVPEGQGLWPAFWLEGNNYATAGWPICGEMDVMEHINAPTPDSILGSVHLPGQGPNVYTTQQYNFSGSTAASWHIYGMIWTKGQIQYYVDTPSNVYATYTASYYANHGATWPFDSGNSFFMLLNLSVGGTLPGNPNSSTPFPSQYLVDYIHIYTN